MCVAGLLLALKGQVGVPGVPDSLGCLCIQGLSEVALDDRRLGFLISEKVEKGLCVGQHPVVFHLWEGWVLLERSDDCKSVVHR